MTKWPISLILIIAFAGGVFAGMPLHTAKMSMKCCDKARNRDRSPAASLARVRCVMDCSETSPTSSGLSFNFSPSSIAIERSITSQIADMFRVERALPAVGTNYRPATQFLSFQPRYIQHHAFLI